MLQKNKGRIDSTDSTIIKIFNYKNIINNKLLYKNINTKTEINFYFFNFLCLHKETNIHKYAQGKSAHIVQFIYVSLHYYSIYSLLILPTHIKDDDFMHFLYEIHFFFCLTPCWPRAHLCCFVRCERVRDEPGALRRGSVWELRRQLPVHLPQRQWGIWSCHQPVPLPG